TSNVTASVGRSLLVNLGEAKVQGLGSDIPTQEQIVASALAQIDASQEITLYTTANLTLVDDSPQTLTTYGNSVVVVLEQYPGASVEKVLLAVGNATDSGKSSYLAELAGIATAYKNIARELGSLPVPKTLSPLHLQVVNNFAKIAAACADMQVVLTDPLRGLAGLKVYQSLTEETARLFINIAQALDKNGILFSEDEPGYAWSLLVAQ
ncbi:MAG: hypothetical protein U1C66_00290, partial [Patescibacteria group bacterium]|nr:hypothetical protein [Patescibacteria group bacterium]